MILSTGPIENNPVSGVRPTQQLTVKFVNRDNVNSSTVSVMGYVLTSSRTLYISEVFNIAANAVITKNYFANLDVYELVFTITGSGAAETEVSVWGKDSTGQLVSAHRLVASEQSGA